jgi:hypothetical protein
VIAGCTCAVCTPAVVFAQARLVFSLCDTANCLTCATRSRWLVHCTVESKTVTVLSYTRVLRPRQQCSCHGTWYDSLHRMRWPHRDLPSHNTATMYSPIGLLLHTVHCCWLSTPSGRQNLDNVFRIWQTGIALDQEGHGSQTAAKARHIQQQLLAPGERPSSLRPNRQQRYATRASCSRAVVFHHNSTT